MCSSSKSRILPAAILTSGASSLQPATSMPASLKEENSEPTIHNNVSLYFAATNGEAEFKACLDLITGAKEGALFFMFTAAAVRGFARSRKAKRYLGSRCGLQRRDFKERRYR